MGRIADRTVSLSRRLRYGDRIESRDIEAQQMILPLFDGAWPTWSGSSMRPAVAKLVLDHVVTYKPSLVVELGAGVSTRLLASLIRREQLGTRVVTFEADAVWCGEVQHQLDRAGLADVVDVVHAPLTEEAAAGYPDARLWYDRGVIEDALRGADGNERAIDLLVVDGPAAWLRRDQRNRLPAMELHSRLSDDAIVILDDALRGGERQLRKQWTRLGGITFELRKLDGVAIGHKSDRRWI